MDTIQDLGTPIHQAKLASLNAVDKICRTGATHFEEMMIPLFVQKKNNFCKAKIRLGLIKDNLFHTLRVNIPEKK